MGKVRNKLIKLLGGYTEKEMMRSEQKYQALLDSKIDSRSSIIINEYIYRVLRDLDMFARKELYGLIPDRWADRMYNVIHNNMLRILVRYLHCGSSIIYKFDVTLDNRDEFKKVLEQDNNQEELLFILEND